jgi:hypothetical protein
MSKRSIKKVRHLVAAPSFKERVQAGIKKQTHTMWAYWKEILRQKGGEWHDEDNKSQRKQARQEAQQKEAADRQVRIQESQVLFVQQHQNWLEEQRKAEAKKKEKENR